MLSSLDLGFIMVLVLLLICLGIAYVQLSHERQICEPLIRTLTGVHGGIYKRVDENRELFGLLFRDFPEVLRRKPYILHWLESHDRFLSALARDVRAEDCVFPPRPAPDGSRPFPRPWPSSEIESLLAYLRDRMAGRLSPEGHHAHTMTLALDAEARTRLEWLGDRLNSATDCEVVASALVVLERYVTYQQRGWRIMADNATVREEFTLMTGSPHAATPRVLQG